MKQYDTTGQGGKTVAAAALLLVLASMLAAAQVVEPPATQPATTAPASRPAGPQPYQPGVWIDWSTRQVLIVGEVVLRKGELELFACAPGTKEHESIVRLHARPLHIYQALGLVGFEPGRPPRYDNDQKKVIPATGERLGLSVRWTLDGRTRTVPVEKWLYDKSRHAPAAPIDWVFAGSVPTEDGQILADYDGTVVCVVDFDYALISAGASHSANNDELWLTTNTDEIPPVSTPVTLIVQAAGPRLLFQIDRFGRLGFDGKPASLRELIQAARDAAAGATAILQYDPALPDIQLRELQSALRQAGLRDLAAEPLPPDQVASSATTQRTRVEEQGLAILQTLADLGQQLPSAIDAVARSMKDKYRKLSERATAAGHAAAGAARVLGNGATQPSPAE